VKVVKVEFHIANTKDEQHAVDWLQYILNAGVLCPSKHLESWAITEVSDRSNGREYKYVEDGIVQ